MARGRDYEYAYVDRAREAQDDWYLQRRREIGEDDFVQTQLEISEPGDAHEREADLIAKNVVNGTDQSAAMSKLSSAGNSIARTHNPGFSPELVQIIAWEIVKNEEDVKGTIMSIQRIDEAMLHRFFAPDGDLRPTVYFEDMYYAGYTDDGTVELGYNSIQLDSTSTLIEAVCTYLHEMNHYIDIWLSSSIAEEKYFLQVRDERGDGIHQVIDPEAGLDPDMNLLSVAEQTDALGEVLTDATREIFEDRQKDIDKDNDNKLIKTVKRRFQRWESRTGPFKRSDAKFDSDLRKYIDKKARKTYKKWGVTVDENHLFCSTGVEMGYLFEKQLFHTANPSVPIDTWAGQYEAWFEQKYASYMKLPDWLESLLDMLKLFRKEDNSATPLVDSSFSSDLTSSKSSGKPLEDSARTEMESKMGVDLGDVKVHTDSGAHQLSESINAKAFTHGQDIYFKSGNYNPSSTSGKELLAHELVHTQQQKAGVSRQIQRSPDGDKAKEELKIILDKKKADNAVKAHQYLKSLSPDVRQEVYDDDEMAKWITWMDENLPVQYLESLDFGFDAGLDKSELTPTEGDTILVQQLSDDATWKDPVKLGLLVMMVTQAGLQSAFVPVLQKQWAYLTPEMQAMLTRNGYDNTGYIGKTTGTLTESSYGRMTGNYLFQSGARSLRKGVVRNFLGIGNTATLIGFSLPMFQKSMGGHVSGVHMSDTGETTTKKELKEQGFKKGKYDPEKYVQTSGTVSLHFDRKEGLFFLNAFDLPFDSMNYQFEDQTVRVGKGTIKKANAKYYWEGKKGSSGNGGKIEVDELVLNNIRSIAGDTTIGIGRLALKTLSITVNQPLGNWQTLPSFYEATLACLDQLLNVLFITMDSGLIVADHFFKGVGAGANTELQQLVNSMSPALGMTISFNGLVLESLVHNKYAFVNKIELGKTDLLFGTDAYIAGYNKSIQQIQQKAADEKRELKPEEQAEIDSLQKAIDNEYRIEELSRLVKAVDAKKSADYGKNQQELDSLLAGRQMAFSITTSSFEVGGVHTRSDATRFDLNRASLQSLNVTSKIGSNGLTAISADWGKSEIGRGENIVDPIGAKYKDETQNYKVGTTMDSGAFSWQEGQGHVLRMKNPVFYSGAIGIGPEAVVDMEFQRKDITRTTLEMPFVGMPFLKAEEVVLTWPPNGDMLPDVEVWGPEVKDVELVTTQEISISPKQYIDEFYKEKSEEERAKLLKGQLNPVVIWQMSDVLRVSGKIDGKLKLVRNFESQQWILELSSEKEKVSFIGLHIVSEPRGDGMTPTGHRLDTQHFFNDDEDTPYPMKPSYSTKGTTETEGETNDKYKFLDDLKNTAISISAFGKTVSIKTDDGGFISPVAALNQIYAGFMDEFEKSPIKRNIRAAIRRMAQHLSGSIEPSFTSWALGWSESEAYSILSTPLSMMDQLRFGTVVSGGYYQLAVYIGGVLRSKTKLAIGDKNTLSKDKTKVRLSAFAEYMTQTSKEEKKAEKYDMVSEALNGALDAFAEEWNDHSLDSHIKYSVNYEEPSQAALVQMIDEWWAQAWPVLAALAPYTYTNYLMGMIAPSMINSLVKMVATSKPAVHFTSDFSFEGAVGTGTFDLSMDSKFNPQVGIPDLTIPQLDKSFGDYHVNLTGFEMHGGLLRTNNWNFAKKDFTCTDASLKTFRLTFPIQKKSISVGAVNDPLEHEADSIASKVANGQNADLTSVQRFFNGVQRKEKEEEAPLDLVDSLDSASGGQSMDENTRTEMESKMGVDFGGVKIHTGNEADTFNQEVNAKAFTYGQDIYFRNGQYNTHSNAGKELLAHELVHTVQQAGSLQRKIQRSPLTPKKFADSHFKDVSGYSWATLQQILKSDGSKEQDENLEILLSALINQNPQLNAQQLWTQLELDPAQLKGFTSASMYAGGTDQLPQFTRTTGSLKTEADLDAGMNELKTGTVEYTRRKHFIFGKKKKEAKRKAASEQTTAFIQQKAGQVDAVITTANDSKHLLETDLQNLASGLNVKLVADAQAKEQQVFAMITTIRPDAEKAKYDFKRFYHGSLTVIDNNTEDQKAKLSLYVQETIRQINELHSTQVDEIKKLYDAFNANVKELAGGFSDQAIGKGGERYNKIETENTTDSQLLKKGKQRAVVNESQEASNEINILAGNTMKDATGLDGMEMITNPDLFGSSEEYESELTQQNAIMNIYNQQAETEMLLDGRAEADKKKALDLWYLYNDKVDQQAVQIIETLTASLQLYYEKLNAFGTLQDEAINAFYTKSVAELNTASQDQVQQSKLRLEQFKTSQQGLKTPRKKKLQEQQDLVSADVDPLVAQANANVKKVNDDRALALTQLDKTIQNGFDALALQGTTDFTAQISALSTEFAATRQKGIDEQLDLRVVHLRQIIRDVKSSKQQMDEQVAITKDIYAEQLVTLDADLTTRLEEFKTEANAIIDGLDKRMDDAEEQAELDELSGALQREQNIIDFREANIKLMGTEDCYALYKQYKSLTHQHKKGAKGKKIRKELEALLARHGLEPKLESYGRLIGSFTQGFKLTVSATALSMVKVFEDTLNSAEKDYSNIQNVEQLFKDLAPFRATTVEATKYEKIANDYAQSTQPKKSVPGTDIMGPGKQLNADEQAEYDYAYAKVATANVVGREQLRPLYGKHPIFDDENLLIQYRTPKSAIGNAKDAKELQSILLTYIADRKKDISTARANIISEEGSNDVFGMDKAVEQVYTQFSIAKDTVQDKILTKEINTYKSNQIALAVVMAILSIALAIITFGEGVPFIVSAWAAAGMLALDAYYIIDSVAQYEKEKGFAGAGIISSDASMIWIFLAVAGAVLDVASLFKSLKIVQVAAQEFSATGDVSKFEKAMADAVELQGLNAKLANKITLAARMRTGYNEAAANFYRLSMTRLRTGIDPSAVAEMVKMAYYSMREGLATFEQFVILIKRSWVQKGLMASMDEAFTPEELAAVKKAWQEAAGDVEQGVVKVEQKVVTVIIKESEELLDQGLIQELKNLGTKFSEADLKFICKDVDGKILFLEKGNSGAGLQHIIERHWNPKELMKYFSDQEEMIQKIFSTLKNDKYITKEIVMRNGKEGLEYTYKMSVKGGERTFKIGVGSNGYVVTFYPQ